MAKYLCEDLISSLAGNEIKMAIYFNALHSLLCDICIYLAPFVITLPVNKVHCHGFVAQ